MYAGVSYSVKSLLNDCHVGHVWYPKPHVVESISLDGSEVQIQSTICHKSFYRLSRLPHGFQGLTCSMCATIPNEDDFKKRVVREDTSIVKGDHGQLLRKFV